MRRTTGKVGFSIPAPGALWVSGCAPAAGPGDATVHEVEAPATPTPTQDGLSYINGYMNATRRRRSPTSSAAPSPCNALNHVVAPWRNLDVNVPYKFCSRYVGHCLDSANGNTANGTPLIQQLTHRPGQSRRRLKRCQWRPGAAHGPSYRLIAR